MNVIENVSIRQNVYEFLLVYNSNRRPISYRFRLKRPFTKKFAHLFNQHVFCAKLKRFRWELGVYAGIKKTTVRGLPAGERSLTISSAVMTENTNVTDGRTDTRRQQRPPLCIASRCKNR